MFTLQGDGTEDTTMSNATNPSIPAVHTISESNLAASATHAAFLAGFEAARAGKRGGAPRSVSSAERIAHKHGREYARAFRCKSAQEALESFLATESMWVGSATYCIERDLEAGKYTPVFAG
jgi:hypothetical protein